MESLDVSSPYFTPSKTTITATDKANLEFYPKYAGVRWCGYQLGWQGYEDVWVTVPNNLVRKADSRNCTTPSKLVVYKPMGAQRAEFHTITQSCSFVPFCRRAWCHNNFALPISVEMRDLIAHLNCFCEWNTCYALVTRWLYLARRKKKDEIWLIQGTRFLSIVFNLVNNRGVVQHKWLMVLIRAMVQDFLKSGTIARSTISHLYKNICYFDDSRLALSVCHLSKTTTTVALDDALIILSHVYWCRTWWLSVGVSGYDDLG